MVLMMFISMPSDLIKTKLKRLLYVLQTEMLVHHIVIDEDDNVIGEDS